MKTILNDERLGLSEAMLSHLNDVATQARRAFTILFEVQSVDDNVVTIVAEQHIPFHENTMTAEQISNVTKELFESYLPGKSLQIRPVIYEQSPPIRAPKESTK